MNPFAFCLLPGDFLLFQHETSLGRIIQHLTHSWASHAAFCRQQPDGLIEAADLDGVRNRCGARPVSTSPQPSPRRSRWIPESLSWMSQRAH